MDSIVGALRSPNGLAAGRYELRVASYGTGTWLSGDGGSSAGGDGSATLRVGSFLLHYLPPCLRQAGEEFEMARSEYEEFAARLE